MMKKIFGRVAFREYLSDYNGRMTPDTGPIIAGCGIAATGLALNAASSMNDMKIFVDNILAKKLMLKLEK